jgi:short-subunit dehydrogenase
MTDFIFNRAKYGPWAVVAGASEGTGACFAEEIARAGINLVMVARRLGPLEALASRLRATYGVEIRTVSIDLNAPDAAQRMGDAADGLEVGLYISNAGSESGGRHFLDQPMGEMRDLITRNVLTVVEACYHFARPMRERRRGGIVLMGSGAGLGGQPGVSVYSGVKGFVLNLAESLWAELRHSDVDVIGIAAPVMETPSLRKSLGDLQIPGIFDPMDVVRNALQRMSAGQPSYIYAFGEPSEASEQQTAARLERILAVEKISAAFFSKG